MKQNEDLLIACKNALKAAKIFVINKSEESEKKQDILELLETTIQKINVFGRFSNINLDKHEYFTPTPIYGRNSLNEVLDAMGWTYEEVLKDTRKSEVMEKRRFICFILRNDYRFTLKAIGRLVYNYDHTTIMHHCNTVLGFIQSNDKETLELFNIYNKSQEKYVPIHSTEL